MFAPAGQTTARAGLRSKLAALVVRRQALTPPRGVEDAAPYTHSRELSVNRRGGIHPSRAPSAAVNFPGGLGSGRPTSHIFYPPQPKTGPAHGYPHRQDRFTFYSLLLPVDRHNHAGQGQQGQQVRHGHQAVEQVGQRPDQIDLQGRADQNERDYNDAVHR